MNVAHITSWTFIVRGVVAEDGAGKQLPLSTSSKYCIVCRNDFFFVGKFSSKNARFGAETAYFGGIRDKIKILSNRRPSLLYRKFAAFVEKMQFPAPPILFNPRRR